MRDHHLQLNLPKTEPLGFPASPTIHHNTTFILDRRHSLLQRSARNLEVMIDDLARWTSYTLLLTLQLFHDFVDSCCITSRRSDFIRDYVRIMQLNSLYRHLSSHNYITVTLLTRQPTCSVKPLQMIQNATALIQSAYILHLSLSLTGSS